MLVMKSLLFASAATLMVLASPALGQAAGNAPKPVSKADYVKAIDSRFGAIDSNHDGIISSAEITSVVDGFFDGSNDYTVEKINALIDFFFEQ